MPVEFLCPACHQLLGVAARKIGATVNCPKCQAPIIVPDPNETAACSDGATFDATMFEDALSEIMAAEMTPPPKPAAAPTPKLAVKGTEKIAHQSRAIERPLARDAQPAASDSPAVPDTTRVTISRRMIYLQGALIAIVATIFFLAGYWIGHAGR